jgi:hypothetical protein
MRPGQEVEVNGVAIPTAALTELLAEFHRRIQKGEMQLSADGIGLLQLLRAAKEIDRAISRREGPPYNWLGVPRKPPLPPKGKPSGNASR